MSIKHMLDHEHNGLQYILETFKASAMPWERNWCMCNLGCLDMHACAALNASQVAAALREALPKALPEEPLGRDRGLPLLLLLRKLHEPYYIKYHRHPRGSHIIHDVHIYSFAIWPTIFSGTFYACLKMHEHNMTWYIKYHRYMHIVFCSLPIFMA